MAATEGRVTSRLTPVLIAAATRAVEPSTMKSRAEQRARREARLNPGPVNDLRGLVCVSADEMAAWDDDGNITGYWTREVFHRRSGTGCGLSAQPVAYRDGPGGPIQWIHSDSTGTERREQIGVEIRRPGQRRRYFPAPFGRAAGGRR